MFQPTDRDGQSHAEPPIWQRIYDSPFLLMAAGIGIMVVIYTSWGLWEILTLPPATLP